MLQEIDSFLQQQQKRKRKKKKREKHRTSLIDLVAKICAKKMKRILQGVNGIRIKIKDKNYQLSPHASRALVIMIRKKA